VIPLGQVLALPINQSVSAWFCSRAKNRRIGDAKFNNDFAVLAGIRVVPAWHNPCPWEGKDVVFVNGMGLHMAPC